MGRSLIHVLLRRRGLTPGFVPPISLVLGANAKAVRGSVAFRAGRIAEWCGLFSSAARTAAEEATRPAGRWRNRADSGARQPATRGLAPRPTS